MEKHSMRHLLWTALFLLYCSCGCLATVVQQLPQKGQSALQAYTVSNTADDKTGKEWQPIRIGVYTKRVEDVLKFCEDGKLPPEYEDEFLETDEVQEEFAELCGVKRGNKKLIAEKKDILLNKVLPKAIKLHADRLNVKQVKESLKIESEDVLPEECEGFGIPEGHKEKGIPDADFVIYASLSTNIGHGICSKDKQGRPTSAVIKFNLYDIEATRKYIRFTAHEIAHGLGFQHEFMDNLTMIEPSNKDGKSKGVSRGLTPRMVKFVKSVDKLKSHYNCDGEVKGLYLENYISWTSHWRSRIAKDELMSTYIGEPTGMYYTALTLATFHEMPFYSANFTMAEPMSWGNQSICEFLQGKKDPAETRHPNVFCEENEKVTLQCTSDRFALGMCLTKNNLGQLPNGYQYFNDISVEWDGDLMDGDAIIRPFIGTDCEDGNETLLPGSLFGRDSRCLKAEGLKITGSSDTHLNIAGVCAKVKCDNEKKEVSVQLKGYTENNKEWHECSDDKANVELTDSEFSGGTIKCPKYEEVCIGLLETEAPSNITFYNGTKFTDGYVDLHDENKEEEEKTTKNFEPPHSQSVSPTVPTNVNQNVGSLPVATPLARENEERQKHQGPDEHRDASQKSPESMGVQNRVAPTVVQVSSSGTANAGNDNGSAVGTVGTSSNGRNLINAGRSTQSVPSSAPAPANTDLHETLKEKIADPPAANNDQQNATQTSTKAEPSSGPRTPAEANAQTDKHGKISSPASTEVQSDGKREENPSRWRRDVDDATSSSTSNPNSNDNPLQSTNTVNGADDRSSGTVNSDALNGTKFTEGQIKEETLNHTNIMSALGPDSSIMVSYMAPLALLVCVVGFVMVP
ncbi:putative surface protease GP63 [Trypanosoma theileri]|uniref:Leishmanolysin-like peptidase n=1 Tax=Trypanosoma theileri TaxID=67003 RepID=A0A1X0NGP3_9TRYP|nr:putative surface protease GP63 [Trypanosoma theileri]ORC83623.1 putative surface protease GP63 [Trypanosoma theileri]